MNLFDGWQERKGRTDLDNPVCPYCNAPYMQEQPPAAGLKMCPTCSKVFLCHATNTPLGWGWSTWKLELKLTFLDRPQKGDTPIADEL